VYLVLLVAALAILGGVVVVAMGRGGEMASFRRDLPLPLLRFRSPAEVAAVRLPLAPFGYQVQAAGDALAAAATLVAERDAEIALLRRELLGSLASAGSGAAEEPAAGEVPGEDPADQDAGLTVERRPGQ
jgi:hypothetical protein